MIKLASAATKTVSQAMLVFVCVANLTLASPDSSYGQSPSTSLYPQEVLDQFYRAAKRMVKLIISEFSPHLTSREKRDLEEIEISISYSEDVNHVFAFRHSVTGRRDIQISLGFIVTMVAILDAFIVGNTLGRMDDSLDYVEEVTKLMQENSVRLSRGWPPRVVPQFIQFAGISKQDIYNVYPQEQFLILRDRVLLDAFAFVLAHELAHHLLGHLDFGNTTYEDEKEADEFALDLGVKAGYLPIFGALPYLYYIHLEEILQNQVLPRSHPSPICRALRFFDVGIAVMLKDKELVPYLEENNLKNTWIEGVRLQQELFVENCNE